MAGPWRVLEESVEPEPPAVAGRCRRCERGEPRASLARGRRRGRGRAGSGYRRHRKRWCRWKPRRRRRRAGGRHRRSAHVASSASVGAWGDPSARALGSAGSALGSSDSSDLVVEVNGAVRRPGLYHLPAGSRAGDAIAAAGGYSGRVDAIAAQSLNLAARVTDGQQIHAPSRDERLAPAATPAGPRAPGAGPAAERRPQRQRGRSTSTPPPRPSSKRCRRSGRPRPRRSSRPGRKSDSAAFRSSAIERSSGPQRWPRSRTS